MNCFFVAIAVSVLAFSTVSEARTRLLVEVSQEDITLSELQEFLARAIQATNSSTIITAIVSDVNECETFTLNTCSEFAKCTNLEGSFSCECPPTFIDVSEDSSPGRNCSDINECITGKHNCSENSQCVNTIGGFNCSCLDGFTGDGINCRDINECGDPTTHKCSKDAVCVNAIGHYSCVCKNGFKGDGFSCTTSTTTTQTTSTGAFSSTYPLPTTDLSTAVSITPTTEASTTMERSTTSAVEGISTTAPLRKDSGRQATTSQETSAPTTDTYHTTTVAPTAPTLSHTDELTNVPTTTEHSTTLETTSVTTQVYATSSSPPETQSSAFTAETSATTQPSIIVTTTSNPITATTDQQFTSQREETNSRPSLSPTDAATTQQSTEIPTSEWQTVSTTVDGMSSSTMAYLTTIPTDSVAEIATMTYPDSTAKVSSTMPTEKTQSYETTLATETSETPTKETTASTATRASSAASSTIFTTTTSVEKDAIISDVPSTTVKTEIHSTLYTKYTLRIETSTHLTSSAETFTTSPTTETSTQAVTEIVSTSSPTTEATSTTPDTEGDTTTTSDIQTTRITVSHSTETSQTTAEISSYSETQTASSTTHQLELVSTTTEDEILNVTMPPLKPPRFNGNRTEYLGLLQNLLSDLTKDPSQSIDISEASSTINDFETLIADGNVDENLVDITTDVVLAFFDASVVNGEVQMTVEDSAKITKFVPNVLVAMNLPTDVYRKVEGNLALQALDVNFNVTDNAEFDVAEGSVQLPRAFIEPTGDLEKEQAPNSQRVAFTRYSDSRFFAANDIEYITPTSEITAAALPARSKIINSPVIGASVRGRNITNSIQQATVRLNVLIADPLQTNFNNGTKEIVSYTGNPRCVWWDYDSSDWSESGCEFGGLLNGTVTCKCNHLTSFAVIMTVEKTVEDQVLSYLSYIGAGLSITGLLLTILTYSIFRSLRKSRSKRILLHFSVALCAVYTTYVFGIAAKLPANQGQCIASGFFMHYFTLSVMAWMSVEVFDMYIMFVKIMQISFHKYLLKAGLVAWLTPLVVAIIPLIVHVSMPDMDIYPIYNGGTTVCWLGQTGMLYAFIIPSSIILIANLVLFCIVLRNVTCKRNNGLVGRIGRRSGKSIKASQHVINALALLLLAGPTWIIGYLINVEPIEDGVLRRILSYIFVILNAFQGFWIFIVFCIRPPSVRNKWVALIRRGKLDDRSRTYLSSSSQRNTTKATSMSPRPSLFPDSSITDGTNTASKNTKQPVISTYSSSSCNSNNSNSKISNNSSTSPLTASAIDNQRKEFVPRGVAPLI